MMYARRISECKLLLAQQLHRGNLGLRALLLGQLLLPMREGRALLICSPPARTDVPNTSWFGDLKRGHTPAEASGFY